MRPRLLALPICFGVAIAGCGGATSAAVKATAALPAPQPRASVSSGRDELAVLFRDGPAGTLAVGLLDPATGVVGKRVMRSVLGGLIGNAAWSQDAKRLAISRVTGQGGAARTTFVVVDRASGRVQRLATRLRGDQAGALSFSPDGRRLLVAADEPGQGPGIYMVDTTGASTRPVRVLSGNALDPAWSPAGDLIAFTAGRGIRAVDLRTRDVRTIVSDGGGAAWSPDGRRIAFVSGRDHHGSECFEDGCGPAPELYVADADGSHQRRLTHTTTAEHDSSWSPDGRWLAVDRQPQDSTISQVIAVAASGRRSCDLASDATSTGLSLLKPEWRPATTRFACSVP